MSKFVVSAVCSVLFLGLAAPSAADASPGDPDPAFGNAGQVRLSAPGIQPVLRDLARLSDGRILAAGGSRPGGDGLVMRVSEDGSPDPTFGVGGSAVTRDSLWASIQPLPDGRILAFGRSGPDAAVARFNADGSLDVSFGEGGIRVLPVRSLFRDPAATLETRGPGLDPEGRIVAAVDSHSCGVDDKGDGESIGWNISCERVALVRLTADGDLDPAFGEGDGVRLVVAASNPRVEFADDGRMIIAGSEYENFEDGNLSNVGIRWLRRLNKDGSVDPGFGEDGWVELVDDREHSTPSLIETAEDGSLLVVYEMTVTRLDAHGRPDPDFGEKGTAPIEDDWLRRTTRVSLRATGALAEDDFMYLTGTAIRRRDPRGRFSFVLRLTPEGEPDPTFSNDGVALRRIGPILNGPVRSRPGINDGPVLVDEQGRVTVGATGGAANEPDLRLTRFLGGTGVRLTCQGRPATVQGTDGDDRLLAGKITATGSGNDVVQGHGERICTGAGADRVLSRGNSGRDLIRLGAGRDVMKGAVLLVDGGSGDDRIVGPSQRVIGGTGDDRIDSRLKNDRYPIVSNLFGGPGDDVLRAGRGRSLVHGGAGRDAIYGGRGEDRLFGGPGVDRLFGGPAADLLVGGPGRDRLDGGGNGPEYRRYGVTSGKVRGWVDLLPGRVVRSRVRVRAVCRYDGGRTESTWRSPFSGGLKVKNGKIRNHDGYESPWGDFGSEEIAARVTRRSIAARYWSLDGWQGTVAPSYRCRTGNVRFTLHRKHPPRQIVRQ